MMLVMNLKKLGFKNTMVVVYNFTDSKLQMAENVPAATRNDWYVKIKTLLKTYSTPGMEKATPNVPTMETINSSQFTITHHKFGNFEKVYIIRRFDDEIYPDYKLENPYNEVFAHHSISCKNGKSIPELEHLQAYAAAEEGIFYVTSGSDKLMYMHRNGKKYALAEVKDIMNMSYKDGVVTYTVFEKVNQTGWNEHMDICGGLSEQWVDVYQVISRTETYNTAKLMNYIRQNG